MHFLFCKYEKGPKLVEYLENPDHASKTKNIAFGLVNKIGMSIQKYCWSGSAYLHYVFFS